MCENLTDWEQVRDRFMDRLLAYHKEKYNVDEGPCGRVLNSADTPEDLDKAQQFNIALSTLLARKAAKYNGGVRITFTNVLYKTPLQPNYVSHLDCYHPNRAGQMKMAQVLWQAFNRTSTGVHALWYDEFENKVGAPRSSAPPGPHAGTILATTDLTSGSTTRGG